MMPEHPPAARRLSVRLYRLLLYLYPRPHRRVYGAQMAQLFADLAREAPGGRALLLLWLRTARDLLTTVPGEHLRALWGSTRGGNPYPRLPWRQALLAGLPGLLLVLTSNPFFLPLFRLLPRERASLLAVETLAVPLVCLALVACGLVRERRLPPWGC